MTASPTASAGPAAATGGMSSLMSVIAEAKTYWQMHTAAGRWRWYSDSSPPWQGKQRCAQCLRGRRRLQEAVAG